MGWWRSGMCSSCSPTGRNSSRRAVLGATFLVDPDLSSACFDAFPRGCAHGDSGPAYGPDRSGLCSPMRDERWSSTRRPNAGPPHILFAGHTLAIVQWWSKFASRRLISLDLRRGEALNQLDACSHPHRGWEVHVAPRAGPRLAGCAARCSTPIRSSSIAFVRSILRQVLKRQRPTCPATSAVVRVPMRTSRLSSACAR